MKPFKIAGVSFWPEMWKTQKNLREVLTHIRTAAEMGADVIATPEGIIDGYITRDLVRRKIRWEHKHLPGWAKRVEVFRAKQLALADRIKARCIPPLQAEAARLGVWLFANTLDRRRGKSVYNTTFVINPAGKIVGKYDKIHAGHEVVNKIGRAHRVFETPFASIGVLICADRQYPEAPRSLALAGAQVLIINSYGGYGEGWNERIIRQRAYENGMFVLFCHPGESVLMSPEGRIISSTCAWENVIVREIDPAQAVGRGNFGSAAMAKTYFTDADGSAHAKVHARKRAKKV